jgi:hypothetical protein
VRNVNEYLIMKRLVVEPNAALSSPPVRLWNSVRTSVENAVDSLASGLTALLTADTITLALAAVLLLTFLGERWLRFDDRVFYSGLTRCGMPICRWKSAVRRSA